MKFGKNTCLLNVILYKYKNLLLLIILDDYTIREMYLILFKYTINFMILRLVIFQQENVSIVLTLYFVFILFIELHKFVKIGIGFEVLGKEIKRSFNKGRLLAEVTNPINEIQFLYLKSSLVFLCCVILFFTSFCYNFHSL